MDLDEQHQMKSNFQGDKNAKLIGEAKVDLKQIQNRLSEIANVSYDFDKIIFRKE